MTGITAMSDANGLYLRFNDGSEINITPQTIRQRFLAESGTLAQRRAAVIQWIKDQVAVARPELLTADYLDLDFTQGDGRLSRLELRRP